MVFACDDYLDFCFLPLMLVTGRSKCTRHLVHIGRGKARNVFTGRRDKKSALKTEKNIIPKKKHKTNEQSSKHTIIVRLCSARTRTRYFVLEYRLGFVCKGSVQKECEREREHSFVHAFAVCINIPFRRSLNN